MDAVAEGVETEGQLELLKEMECDYAQGYRFSRPVDSEGAWAILAAEPVW
nr:EAL domain-containing protein [Actinomycetota bacterium]